MRDGGQIGGGGQGIRGCHRGLALKCAAVTVVWGGRAVDLKFIYYRYFTCFRERSIGAPAKQGRLVQASGETVAPSLKRENYMASTHIIIHSFEVSNWLPWG